MNKIPKFLLPPVFPGDEDKTRRASLLHVILLAFLTALLIYSLFTPLPANMYIDHWLYASPIFAIMIGMLFLNRRGYVKLASSITVLALIGILIPASISTGGVRGLAYAGFILVVLCAGLLIGETAGILTALASILAGLVFTYLETTGVIPVSVSQRIPVMVVWAANAMYLFMSAVVLTLAVRNINRAMQRSRRELEERTRAEESLRQSEQRLQTVFENMPILMAALDKDLSVLHWNHECELVTGYKAEDVVGSLAIWQTLIPDEEYRIRMQTELVSMPDNNRDFEMKITCKNGAIRTILWSNISQQVRIAGWYTWGVGVDVTNMRQAETELRQYTTRLETLRQIDQDILAPAYSLPSC
jgi:PAS domain S-box-containing protein